MAVIEKLGDDELTAILNKISNKNDFKSFTQVSKRFLKVACFRLVSFRNISISDMLYIILPASPNMKKFTSYTPLSNTHLILLSQSCPKLKNLTFSLRKSDSGFHDFDDDGLRAVANGCKSLRFVDIKKRLNFGDLGVTSLVKSGFKTLFYLELEGCVNVSDESLKAIGEATSLRYLRLQGCRLITDLGLEYLSNGDLKNCLKSLDLSECDRISDVGIVFLKNFVCLKFLFLKKCGDNITDSGVVALLSEIPDINKLDLSWLINITDISLCFMATKCLELWSISLNGCDAITVGGVNAFTHYPRQISFELDSCRNFFWEDSEFVDSTCSRLEFVGHGRGIETRMPEPGP